MGTTQSVLDISGEWFLGAVKADSVRIGANSAFVVDNTTTPATVSANGIPLKADFWYGVSFAGVIAPVANNTAITFTTPTLIAPGASITTPSTTRFSLNTVGLYEISWQASISGATAQIGLYLVSGNIGEVAANNIIPRTVVGRARTASQLTNTTLVRVVTAPAVLELRNVSGGSITFTEDAGGITDVVVSMRIVKSN